MKNILLIHGPNLNLLGKRDPEHYGRLTLKDIEEITFKEAKKYGLNLTAYQSNHEGDLIDMIQQCTPNCAGIIINPGAFTHYSYAIHDALLDTKLPIIEVHLSNISKREDWRKISVTAPACLKMLEGEKEKSYIKAVQTLSEAIDS